MKKEKIFSIAIAVISFALFFMPTIRTGRLDSRWMFIAEEVIGSFLTHSLHVPFYIFQLFIVIIGIATIAVAIVNAVTNKRVIQLSQTVIASVYVIFWLVILFADIPLFGNAYSLAIYKRFVNNGADILWLILYLIMLLSILILSSLPYIPAHRPTKAERMQAQIDELQKQVDELKKGD